MPLTESKGSRAGGRSIEEMPFCCRRWLAGMVWSKARSTTEGVDMFDFASAWVEEGESVEVKGVAFIEGPADVAVATGNAEALNSEEDELACELAEPPVLGMSPGDDPLSSACGCVGSDEEVFWQGRARSFVVSASVTTADSCAVSTAWTPRFDRSRSARPWTSVLNFGALGKNCAKLTPGGGRVIVSMSSCYLMHRGVIMIPRSVTGRVYHA
jgi:hypothetical protein